MKINNHFLIDARGFNDNYLAYSHQLNLGQCNQSNISSHAFTA